jgi:hypothetical protein
MVSSSQSVSDMIRGYLDEINRREVLALFNRSLIFSFQLIVFQNSYFEIVSLSCLISFKAPTRFHQVLQANDIEFAELMGQFKSLIKESIARKTYLFQKCPFILYFFDFFLRCLLSFLFRTCSPPDNAMKKALKEVYDSLHKLIATSMTPTLKHLIQVISS